MSPVLVLLKDQNIISILDIILGVPMTFLLIYNL